MKTINNFVVDSSLVAKFRCGDVMKGSADYRHKEIPIRLCCHHKVSPELEPNFNRTVVRLKRELCDGL